MSKTTSTKKGRGPAVIRFSARLVRDSNAAKNGSVALLDIPNIASKKLRGMANVEGTINGHPFRASLERNSSGFRLPVNRAMRAGAGAGVGDTVKLAVLGPEPEPAVPPDLRAAFSASLNARALWKDLTLIGRLDWIRWIESAKTPETRARRVRRTVEQLSSGKRRPCCVNVYEFMLSRVEE